MNTKTQLKSCSDSELKLFLADELAMVEFGELWAQAGINNLTLFLHGNLGMGKTTFCRGVLRGYGHQGSVKSPTYTLVEPYELSDQLIYHFDLYRLADPEELEYLGIRDYFSQQALRLIEWPEKGYGVLPQADMEISISLAGQGRELSCVANNQKAQSCLAALARLLMVVE